MQLLCSASVLQQNQLMVMAAPRGPENGSAVCSTFRPETITGLFHGSFEGPTFGCNWLYGLWPEELTEEKLTEVLLTWLCSKSSLGAMTAIQTRFETSLQHSWLTFYISSTSHLNNITAVK